MNKNISYSIAFLIPVIVLLFSIELNAQWVNLSNGINGGSIITLTANNNYIYAGTYGEDGIFYSTNTGASWSKSNFPYGVGAYVYSIAVKDNYVIAGTQNGICVSTDNGVNFTGRSLYTTYIYGLAVSGTDIFASAKDSGVYRSTNNGANWTRTSLGNISVIALAVSGSTVYAGSQTGVYYTTNNGTNWTQTSLTSSIYSMAANGSYVYAGTASGILLSSNNGANWVLSSLNTDYVRGIKISSSNMYACTDAHGIYMSTNNGMNWSVIGMTSFTNQSITVAGNTVFAGTIHRGIYVTTNNGTSWTQSEFHNVSVSSFLKIGNNLYTGTYPANVYLSTNNGASWTGSPSSVIQDMGVTGPFNIYSLTSIGSSLYAGTYGGVFKSTDNNITWSRLTGLNTNGNAIRGICNIGNVLIAAVYSPGTEGGIYRSTNNGVNWTMTFSGKSVFSFAVTDRVFAGTAFNGVYVSTDSGATWNQSLALNDYFIYGMAASGINVYAGLGNNGGLVYRSTNNGANWSSVVLHSGDLGIHSLAALGNYVFAAGSSAGPNNFKGVYYSSNSGANWVLMNEGIQAADQDVYTVFIADNYVYAGMRRTGVYRRNLSEFVGISQTNEIIPASFMLNQNYPNPFNPSTNIKYSVPRQSLIKIVIYDLLGREVAMLVNEVKQAGEYNVSFDASSLSSGVYYYKMEARQAGSLTGDFIDVKKMVLVK